MKASHRKNSVVLSNGLRILNPKVGRTGILGLIARDKRINHAWIVSCYHILCRFNKTFPRRAAEPIYLIYSNKRYKIAEIIRSKINKKLDCAAAKVLMKNVSRIIPNITHMNGHKIKQSTAPKLSMKVVKYGSNNRKTEGQIDKIGARIEIIPLRRKDQDKFNIDGDSGAIWFEHQTLAPVAINCEGSLDGRSSRAYGISITKVLDSLSLKLIASEMNFE